MQKVWDLNPECLALKPSQISLLNSITGKAHCIETKCWADAPRLNQGHLWNAVVPHSPQTQKTLGKQGQLMNMLLKWMSLGYQVLCLGIAASWKQGNFPHFLCPKQCEHMVWDFFNDWKHYGPSPVRWAPGMPFGFGGGLGKLLFSKSTLKIEMWERDYVAGRIWGVLSQCTCRRPSWTFGIAFLALRSRAQRGEGREEATTSLFLGGDNAICEVRKHKGGPSPAPSEGRVFIGSQAFL